MTTKEQLVKTIGDMRTKGLNYHEIADGLNYKGIKTTTGKKWDYTAVNNFTYNHINKMSKPKTTGTSKIDIIESIANSNIEPTMALFLIKGITQTMRTQDVQNK